MAKAIIAGGGIGGLTAAVALGRAGVGAVVFERAPELEDRTAGIVKRSRLVGRLVQLESPPLCRLRDAVARRISARAQLRQYEEIARYEA